MKNLMQLSAPVIPAATCAPASRWLLVSPMTVAGAELRHRIGHVAPVTDGPGIRVHEAKSASLTGKPALVSRLGSTTNQLDAYGFGNPVGVVAERDGVPTGIPPRSRPV